MENLGDPLVVAAAPSRLTAVEPRRVRHSLTKIRRLTTDLGPLPVLLVVQLVVLPVTAVNHLIERVTRLFTASLAAIALVQTMAVTPVVACEADRKTVALSHEADHPVEQPTQHSDCGEPSSHMPTRHSTECLRACVSMASCGSPGLMPERLSDDVAATESVTPLSQVESYPSRSLEPDRPPPRA